MPGIVAINYNSSTREAEEDGCEFKASWSYKVGSKSAWTAETLSQKDRNKKWKAQLKVRKIINYHAMPCFINI